MIIRYEVTWQARDFLITQKLQIICGSNVLELFDNSVPVGCLSSIELMLCMRAQRLKRRTAPLGSISFWLSASFLIKSWKVSDGVKEAYDAKDIFLKLKFLRQGVPIMGRWLPRNCLTSDNPSV